MTITHQPNGSYKADQHGYSVSGYGKTASDAINMLLGIISYWKSIHK